MTVVRSSENPRTARFDSFEMDFVVRELRKNGLKIRLQDQPFRILEHLVLRAKEPILREELYSYLSDHNSYDSKHALDNAVQRIRKALGDSVENPRFVETLRGRGYRFLSEVKIVSGTSDNSDNSHYRTRFKPDSFLSNLKEIRGELLATDSPQKLSELFYRLSELVEQHREHPNKSEAYVLLENLQSARSQHNRVNHKISFESATLVFEDPNALSISRPFAQDIRAWHTLGRIPERVGTFGRPVVLMVTHQTARDQIRQAEILSARKATPTERAVYEQARKKKS
jgi:DNA-binding winged helix-turn-helix (wHTH) protein/uncharacterized DUF497 family protein